MEGDPGLAEIADKHIREMGYEADIRTGDFTEILDTQLDLATYQPDYVFLDGNHRYEATLEYVNRLLPHMQNGGLIVLDDISWSEGMREAWKEVRAHADITVSIDLYWMGMCFVRRNQAKEYFQFRFRNR